MNNKDIISKFVDTAKAVFKRNYKKLNISITKKKGLKSMRPRNQKKMSKLNPKQAEERK